MIRRRRSARAGQRPSRAAREQGSARAGQRASRAAPGYLGLGRATSPGPREGRRLSRHTDASAVSDACLPYAARAYASHMLHVHVDARQAKVCDTNKLQALALLLGSFINSCHAPAAARQANRGGLYILVYGGPKARQTNRGGRGSGLRALGGLRVSLLSWVKSTMHLRRLRLTRVTQAQAYAPTPPIVGEELDAREAQATARRFHHARRARSFITHEELDAREAPQRLARSPSAVRARTRLPGASYRRQVPGRAGECRDSDIHRLGG